MPPLRPGQCSATTPSIPGGAVTQGHNSWGVKWESSVGEVFSSPSHRGGRDIYVGSYDHNIYAIEQNGNIKWTFRSGDDVLSSPAVGSDGTIYVGSHDNNLYAINPDGSEKWRFKLGMTLPPPRTWEVMAPLRWLSGCNLFAINPDGSERWRFAAEDGIDSSRPSVPTARSIGAYGGNLYAINPGWVSEAAPLDKGYWDCLLSGCRCRWHYLRLRR